MSQASEAPAPSRVNANAAGHEVSSPQADGQTVAPRVDSPVSHLRNALLLLELAYEWTQHGRDANARDGHIFLKRQEAADLTNLIGSAIEGIETADRARLMAETIRDFTPGALVLLDPGQLDLGGLVPRQSAPAFARQESRR